MFFFNFPVIILSNNSSKRFIVDLDTNKRLRVTSREEYWRMEDLLGLSESFSVQLHPKSYSNLRYPSNSIVNMQYLLSHGVMFASEIDSGFTLKVEPHAMLVFEEYLIDSPQRIKKFQHIIPNRGLQSLQQRAQQSQQSQTQGFQMQTQAPQTVQTTDAPPKKRAKLPKVFFAECCICGCESRNFSLVELNDESTYFEEDEILVLCSEEQISETFISKDHHFICGKCVINSFKHTNELPCCPCCKKEDPLHHPLCYYDAIRIFAGSDPHFKDSCIQPIEYDEIPEMLSMEWIDDFLEEGTLLYKMTEKYYIFQQNTVIECACHCKCNSHVAVGQLDMSNQTVDFANDVNLYPVQVVENYQIVTKWMPHKKLCVKCLLMPHTGDCTVSLYSQNPYYRAATKAQSQGRLFRNIEISNKDIKSFISRVHKMHQFHQTCPGCHTNMIRSEACNELVCSCGFRLCAHCGYAIYSCLPVLDHFTYDPKQFPKYCPRYMHQNGSIGGHVCKCTNACQSHSKDCNIEDHQPFKDALTKHQKHRCIRLFIQHLDIRQRSVAVKHCLKLGIHCMEMTLLANPQSMHCVLSEVGLSEPNAPPAAPPTATI